MGLSIFAKHGYKDVISIDGGMDKIVSVGTGDIIYAKCALSGKWKIIVNYFLLKYFFWKIYLLINVLKIIF